MKAFFKVVVTIIIILAITFSIIVLQMDSKVGALLGNTFVPSSSNISQIDQNINPLDENKISTIKFSDFNESTIDKNGFYLRIDKIGLFKQIIENVDPRYKEEYVESWDYGISHGKFTSTPDKIGLTYLFAHAISDKSKAESNKAWFSNMDKLSNNDQIIIYFKGIKYIYEVSLIQAVSPKATAFYTGASVVPMVRMQYCGPPTGSLESRTLVDALLINQQQI
jgi:sortase (surface protein transpeptidase)